MVYHKHNSVVIVFGKNWSIIENQILVHNEITQNMRHLTKKLGNLKGIKETQIRHIT